MHFIGPDVRTCMCSRTSKLGCRSGFKSCSDKARILPGMHTPQFTLLPPPLFYEPLTQGMSMATCAVSWTDTHTHTYIHAGISLLFAISMFHNCKTILRRCTAQWKYGHRGQHLSTCKCTFGLTTTKAILSHVHWIAKARSHENAILI